MTASDSSAAEPPARMARAHEPGLGPAWGTPPGVPELPPDDGTGMVSIGVTLDVPEPYGSQLQSLRASLGDARGTSVPAHITLIPPMEIPATAWPIVREHIRSVANATSPFTLQLRGTGTFMPTSPVVFIAVARGISECQQLSEALRHGVLNQQLAFPYHPHVTIAQELDEEVLERAYRESADYDVSFMAHGFGVYFHTADEEWQLFDNVPFGP